MSNISYRMQERSWDHGTKHAMRFIVTVPNKPEPITKQFAYAKYGSKRAAIQAGKKWLYDLERKLETNPQFIAGSSLTVSEGAQLYLDEVSKKKYNRASDTISWYRTHLVNVRTFFGERPIASLTKDDITMFVSWLENEGKSQSYISRILQTFGQCFEVCKHFGKVPSNIVHEWKPPVRASVRQDMEEEEKFRVQLNAIPTEDQVRDIFNASRGWFKTALLVAFSTGMRWGEIRGLLRENVILPELVQTELIDIFPHGFIKILTGANSRGEIGPVKTKKGKRVVPLAGYTADALREYLATHSHQIVFCRQNGKAYDLKALTNKFWVPTLLKAGLEEGTRKTSREYCKNGKRRYESVEVPDVRYTPHATRHFAVSWFISQGITGKQLSDIIGHKTWAYTQMKYYHLLPPALRQTAEDVDASTAKLLGIDTEVTVSHVNVPTPQLE